MSSDLKSLTIRLADEQFEMIEVIQSHFEKQGLNLSRGNIIRWSICQIYNALENDNLPTDDFLGIDLNDS